MDGFPVRARLVTGGPPRFAADNWVQTTTGSGVLLRDRFTDGRYDLTSPAGERDDVRCAATRREEHEARGAVLQHGAGQFPGPLGGRSADPVAVAVTGSGQWPLGDLAREVNDRTDLAGIAARGRRRVVDDRPTDPVHTAGAATGAGTIRSTR